MISETKKSLKINHFSDENWPGFEVKGSTRVNIYHLVGFFQIYVEFYPSSLITTTLGKLLLNAKAKQTIFPNKLHLKTLCLLLHKTST